MLIWTVELSSITNVLYLYGGIQILTTYPLTPIRQIKMSIQQINIHVGGLPHIITNMYEWNRVASM